MNNALIVGIGLLAVLFSLYIHAAVALIKTTLKLMRNDEAVIVEILNDLKAELEKYASQMTETQKEGYVDYIRILGLKLEALQDALNWKHRWGMYRHGFTIGMWQVIRFTIRGEDK